MKGEDMFTKYREMHEELKLIIYELSHFSGIDDIDLIEALTFSQPEEDRVQNSEIARRTETIAIALQDLLKQENNAWYDYLLTRYQNLNDEISFFEFCIRQMGERKSDIIFELLDGDLTWDKIADQYHVSRSLLAVYRKQAIQEYNRMCGLREQKRLEVQSQKDEQMYQL